MAKDIISKPLLKTTYIDNRNGDKVLYLEVPEKISRSIPATKQTLLGPTKRKQSQVALLLQRMQNEELRKVAMEQVKLLAGVK